MTAPATLSPYTGLSRQRTRWMLPAAISICLAARAAEEPGRRSPGHRPLCDPSGIGANAQFDSARGPSGGPLQRPDPAQAALHGGRSTIRRISRQGGPEARVSCQVLVGIEKVFWRSGCGKTPVRRERRFYGRPALPGPACSPEEQSHNVRAVSAICSFPSGRCPAAGRCSVRAVLSGWADAGCGDARRGPLFSAAGGCPAAAQMNGNGPAPDGSAVGGRRRGCLWGARAYLRGGDGPDARSRRNPAAQPLELDAQTGLRRSASVGGGAHRPGPFDWGLAAESPAGSRLPARPFRRIAEQSFLRHARQSATFAARGAHLGGGSLRRRRRHSTEPPGPGRRARGPCPQLAT